MIEKILKIDCDPDSIATATHKYWNKLKQRLKEEGFELVTMSPVFFIPLLLVILNLRNLNYLISVQ